jgi:hypothetical protein
MIATFESAQRNYDMRLPDEDGPIYQMPLGFEDDDHPKAGWYWADLDGSINDPFATKQAAEYDILETRA